MSSTLRSRIDPALRAVRSRQRALGRAVEGPGRERDVLVQIGKSASAAVVAWQVARVGLHSHQPFLAPLAALITVHATVYQSVRGAAQHVLAVLAGVLLAFLTARTLGVEWYSLGLVLVAALVVARWQRLGDSALQVPTTALLALTIAGGVRDTNVLLLPPVHLRSSRDAIASIASGVARLLRSVADGVRNEWDRDEAQDWLERARRLDRLVREARSTTEQGRESLRLNPRASPWVQPLPIDPAALSRAVDSLEHVAVQCRSITATLLDAVSEDGQRLLTADFLSTYAEVLVDVAVAFEALADGETGDQEVENLRGAVRAGGDKWRLLRSRIQGEELAQRDSLPTYGSLLVDAERILDELERAEDSLAVSTP
jgi:cell shape-determining protein MreD